jgi:RNA polymerase sigma factor (sigma-70 family)
MRPEDLRHAVHDIRTAGSGDDLSSLNKLARAKFLRVADPRAGARSKRVKPGQTTLGETGARPKHGKLRNEPKLKSLLALCLLAEPWFNEILKVKTNPNFGRIFRHELGSEATIPKILCHRFGLSCHLSDVMMTTKIMPVTANNDAELVAGTLAGNRDAFSQIVSRYQSLICSLAYSATGSLGQSEDLAQETFITAWKHLGHLRERDKLRSWLCGIARNRINSFLRREGREPNHQAESIEEVPESHSPEPLPLEHTISNEEQAILWRSLERIPVLYREPLVLFYREHQSVEAVAEKLELTEDTVKQRLSRGRKLLQEQVLAFVEGALERTNPGKVFTLAVLAALPALTTTTKAASIGAVAAKGGATVKAAGAAGVFGTILSPLITFTGLYANYRMASDEAHSDEERGHIKAVFVRSLVIATVFCAVMAVPLFWACRNEDHASMIFWALLSSQAIVVYLLTLLVLVLASLKKRRRHLAEILAGEYGGTFPAAAYEYCSHLSLFGLPLLHVRLGDRFDVMRGPVKAWIAIGSSHAVGVIFASGGVAIAPISFGGVAIGLLPFGAIALGVFPIGALALGAWAYGGLAFGWQVFCGCGAAWNAATGGIVFAHDIADGAFARALQANTNATRSFFQDSLFFRCAQALSNHGYLLMLGWVIPLAIQSRIAAKDRRRREQKNA